MKENDDLYDLLGKSEKKKKKNEKDKKNKKKNVPEQSREYDMKLFKQYADNLERYLDAVNTFMIIETDVDEYKKSVKTIKKLIKKLRQGDGDAIINQEAYDEIIEKMEETR